MLLISNALKTLEMYYKVHKVIYVHRTIQFYTETAKIIYQANFLYANQVDAHQNKLHVLMH